MDRKKELREQYKNRDIIGGVYRIFNSQNQKYLLNSSQDLTVAENRHRFAVSTTQCVEMKLREDWRRYGADAFVFEELETLEKKPDQSDSDFKEDLGVLLELWRDKLDRSLTY